MNPTRWWPTVIGITGFAAAGKDTAAEGLMELGYERRALADKVREFAEALNPLVPDGDGWRLNAWLDGMGWEKAKRRSPEVRNILKDVGMGGRHVFGFDFWVDRLLDNRPEFMVVPDVRFVNEEHLLRSAGGSGLERTAGIIIRVERPGYGPESSFEKEVALIQEDVCVRNDGSVEDLHFAVKDAFLSYMATGVSRLA